MKTIILLIFLLLFQTAHSGYEITTDPSEPKVGDVITINSWVFCPQSAATQNIDGDLFSIEFKSEHELNLTSYFDNNTGCILAPPVPISFEIGQLDEGAYDLNVFYQALDNMIPIGSTIPGFSFSFQVGPAPSGGSPHAVDTMSKSALFLLIVFVLSIGTFFSRSAMNK